MNLEQFQADWQSHSVKLDECVQLNHSLLKKVQAEKQSSELEKLLIARIVEGVLFFVITFFLWKYIAQAWSPTAPVISALVLVVFSIIGLAGNIGQIVLLRQIDYANPVKRNLTHLIKVRSHNINVFKLLVLSIPFYMAYVFLGYELVFDIDLFELMSGNTKILFTAIAGVLFIAVITFISKLKLENRSNFVINWFFDEITGKRLSKLLTNAEHMEKTESAGK